MLFLGALLGLGLCVGAAVGFAPLLALTIPFLILDLFCIGGLFTVAPNEGRALQQISQKQMVDLDNDRKAAMVSNLLVVLCGDREPQPIVYAGTIYQ